MDRFNVKLSQLVVNPDINPRHASDDDVSDLVAQIKTNGFTDALWVRTRDGAVSFEIIDGSRRFRALQILDWQQDIPVDVIEADDTLARELALAANVARSDLTPADEAVAFHNMAKGGAAVKDIAARFAATEKLVKQRIAIGSLPDVIIQALRAGQIDLATAQAFTLTTSPERQLKVFGKGRNLQEWVVRRALTENTLSTKDYRFDFVGHQDFEAAGGVVTSDLFGDEIYITDVDLLQRLFDEKVRATIQDLKDKGWKWVLLLEGGAVRSRQFQQQNPKGKAELTEEQTALLAGQVEQLKIWQAERYALQQKQYDDDDYEPSVEESARFEYLEDLIFTTEETITFLQVKPFTRKQMSTLGVLLLCRNSGLEFGYGYLDPKDVKTAKNGTAADPDEAPDDVQDAPAPVKAEVAGYSDAIELQLLGVARECTRLALTQKPAMAYRLGLAARVATFLNHCDALELSLYPPFITSTYYTEDRGPLYEVQKMACAAFEGCTTYMDVAARLETLTPETILHIEAVLAASLLQVNALKNTDAQALINYTDPDMRATGFAADAAFFKGISRDQLLLISAEIDEGNIIKKGKKPDMVEALLPQVEGRSWLPPQLRTPSYEGPGSEAFEAPTVRPQDGDGLEQESA